MKTKFWKHQTEVLIAWPLIIFFSLAFIIVGIVLSIIGYMTWPYIFIGIIPLIIAFYFLLIDKRALTRLEFSQEGIAVTRFNKQLDYFKWSEIVEAKQTYVSFATYLSFVSKDKQLDISIDSRKIYDTIIATCTNSNIKYMIENLDFLQWFRRKKKNKN